MRQGRDLEEYVARRFAEATGKKVRRRNAMLYNSKYPYAHADVDRLVDGERAGLECKTTTALDAMKRFSSGAEFPERYYVQCVHYLMVTGLERWYLAVLVLGKGFFTFVLDRDEAEIAALAEAEAAFWRYVTEDTPPAVDGMEATQEAISTIYAEGGGGRVPLVGRDGLLTEREALKAQVTALNERINEIEAAIKSDMGEAEEAERAAIQSAAALQKVQTPKATRIAVIGSDGKPVIREIGSDGKPMEPAPEAQPEAAPEQQVSPFEAPAEPAPESAEAAGAAPEAAPELNDAPEPAGLEPSESPEAPSGLTENTVPASSAEDPAEAEDSGNAPAEKSENQDHKQQ